MNYSSKCVELVKKYESCSLTAYKDITGYSIGYGHFGVNEGETITGEMAEQYLLQDLSEASIAVNSMVTRVLTQGQFDALTDFVYNLGATVFHHSMLLHFVNTCNDDMVEKDLCLFTFAGGKNLKILQDRREDEIQLYREV